MRGRESLEPVFAAVNDGDPKGKSKRIRRKSEIKEKEKDRRPCISAVFSFAALSNVG